MAYELVIRTTLGEHLDHGQRLAVDDDDPCAMGDLVSAVLAMLQSMERQSARGEDHDLDGRRLQSVAAVLESEAATLADRSVDGATLRLRADRSARILQIAAAELGTWATHRHVDPSR